MNSIFNYYNHKQIPFSLGGWRRSKLMPLLKGVKNKRVLDVGCASGYIGANLKAQGNYVVGIDITRKDILKAKKVLDEAYVFDIETDNLKKLGGKYDAILIAEVLEHLFEPELALKRYLSILKPDGQIFITTPNIVHVYNRLKVLLGIFEYREETVVNKSHIHFFTRPTLMKMLKNLGLRIIKENDVVLPRTFGPILKFLPNLFASQVVVICQFKDK